MRNHLLAALGILGCALSSGAFAAETPDYQPQDAATAVGLPIHVVFGPDKVRPEIAYGWVDTPYPTAYQAAPGMTYGQTLGVNLAAGLIASLIINAGEKSDAKHSAAVPYAAITAAGCDLDLDKPIGNAVTAAIHGAWPGASVQTHIVSTPQSAGKVLDETAPRYVFQVSTSLAPDFSSMITSIDADAYPKAADSAQAMRKPERHDSMILVTDRIDFPAKTQADIDRLVAEENAHYDALNLGPSIKMINADVESGDRFAHREELKRVTGLMDEHQTQLGLARTKAWVPASLAMRRANTLSENKCSRMNEAIAQSASLASDAIAALAHGTLPPRLAADAKSDFVETAGQRAIVPLPGGIFLWRRGGDDAPLGFRYSILPE